MMNNKKNQFAYEPQFSQLLLVPPEQANAPGPEPPQQAPANPNQPHLRDHPPPDGQQLQCFPQLQLSVGGSVQVVEEHCQQDVGHRQQAEQEVPVVGLLVGGRGVQDEGVEGEMGQQEQEYCSVGVGYRVPFLPIGRLGLPGPPPILLPSAEQQVPSNDSPTSNHNSSPESEQVYFPDEIGFGVSEAAGLPAAMCAHAEQDRVHHCGGVVEELGLVEAEVSLIQGHQDRGGDLQETDKIVVQGHIDNVHYRSLTLAYELPQIPKHCDPKSRSANRIGAGHPDANISFPDGQEIVGAVPAHAHPRLEGPEDSGPAGQGLVLLVDVGAQGFYCLQFVLGGHTPEYCRLADQGQAR